ncbi:MAG TPA: response regulator [Pyrinomonadaceae bacterium]|nr:response regulator [Pyrinomonadaceae bacterium]
MTVLVVDDFEDTRVMLRRMLETHDYRVMEASDGQEAVEMAQRACPNLILMDLNMPLVDGLAAATQIRACKGRCRNVPILAMTAFDTYGMKEAALEAGCDDYITKPIAADDLDRVLHRLTLG